MISLQNNTAADNFNFSDKTIRKKFISKVYSILSCQLLITLLFVAAAVCHEPTKLYLRSHIVIGIIAMIVSFGTLIALAYCEDLRRKTPINFILLFVFTIAESILVAMITTKYYGDQVLLAIGITTLLVFALTIFALQTKIDFTVMGGVLFIALFVFVLVSIVALFFQTKLMTLIIASAGAVLFSIYLIYDTQLMMGGHYKYSISPEEYIFAAINIYLDILNIFIYILSIIGSSDD